VADEVVDEPEVQLYLAEGSLISRRIIENTHSIEIGA
jgi:hypothetical protein